MDVVHSVTNALCSEVVGVECLYIWMIKYGRRKNETDTM